MELVLIFKRKRDGTTYSLLPVLRLVLKHTLLRRNILRLDLKMVQTDHSIDPEYHLEIFPKQIIKIDPRFKSLCSKNHVLLATFLMI